MAKPCPYEADILRQAAEVKACDRTLAKATEYLAAAQSRFMRISESLSATEVQINTARLEAEASFEACLDAIKQRGDHVKAIQQAKQARTAAQPQARPSSPRKPREGA